MANVPISNMTATWTDSGTTYNAVKMNVTDTASNAASLLMDLQVGGTSRFNITKSGQVIASQGFSYTAGNIATSSSTYAYLGTPADFGVGLAAVATLGWHSTTPISGSKDTILTRDNAANTLAQRNATNAQTFRVYNTYTDASNYERGSIGWSGNILTIAAENAGTGANRGITLQGKGETIVESTLSQITFRTSSTGRWAVYANGILGTIVDNALDIGASGANRPRYLYLGGGSLTGTAADSSVTISPTWNTTGTPTAILLNVTDTASNASSQVMDLQVGGISQFKVRKDGFVLVNSRQNTSNFVGFTGSTGLLTTLIFLSGTGTYGGSVRMAGTQLGIHTAGAFGFTTQANTTDSDVLLERDAADTLALRRTTNAQTFRVYNTFTDASNYERGKIAWSSNVLQIGTEKLGTGTARALEFQTDGTTRLTIASGGGVTVQAGFALTCEYLYGPSTRLVLGNNANQLVTIGGFTSSFPALKRVGANLQTVAADDTATAGLIVGNQALATTATDGFLYVPTCAGTPTGTPTARTGTVPIVVDTTNNKLYFYSGAAWRDAGP